MPDPRAFALHKAWPARGDDRDPIKRERDLGQARLVAELVATHLPPLGFDAQDLAALPSALRHGSALLRAEAPLAGSESGARTEPDW